jgi:predicted ATPase
MITQIEVDGFKTLQQVVLPLRPFQAFAGPNNAGKSNLFDALRLLSMLPDHDLPEILQSVRGDPFEIFTQLPDGTYANRMKLAIEILLNGRFTDEFEGDVDLKRTWLRYEIEIERDESVPGGRVQIAGEQLLVKSSRDKLPWKSSRTFRDAYLRFKRRNADYISIDDSGQMIVHQDGAEKGRPRPMRSGTRQSVLYVIRDAGEFPHICAVRNELRSWRFMHLDPEMMREPNAVDGPDRMESNGRYLAASLHRIMQADETAEAEMSNWVRQVIPGGRRVRVRHLEDLHRYVVELDMEDGRRFSSRVLSDGTLRLLALLALQYDPDQAGVICLEEPENGVHPRRLATVIELLKSMASEPTSDDVAEDDPLRQVLINTHSPLLVDALELDDLILVEEVTQFSRNGKQPARHTVYRPVVSSSWGPLFAPQTDEPTLDRLHRLLEERDLGSLWIDGALGGVQ